uniref:FERM domain-containing protein n=1 Tax=Panagrolaimus superbus TaxID=310955 RepID=A0A914YEE3_9BILA
MKIVDSAVLGDYDPVLHPMGYVSEYKLIIKQTERLEEKISDYHKQLRGMNNVVAEREFVNLATSIETYGFDPYVVKDGKQSQDLVVGATCRGILVFSKNQLLKNIPW